MTENLKSYGTVAKNAIYFFLNPTFWLLEKRPALPSFIYENMERLDQGYLYPKSRGPRTDVSHLGIEPGPPWWEASTLAKIHSSTYEPATWLSSACVA